MSQYTYHRAPDGTLFRIHLEQDPDAESPRNNDGNIATLITWENRNYSPDDVIYGDFPSEYVGRWGVDLNRVRKYRALFLPEILFVTGLERGPFNGDPDGLALTEIENRACGIAYVDRHDWEKAMGADYDGGLTPAAAVQQEIDAYNAWAAGEYVGYIVERGKRWHDDDGEAMITWERTDFECWGFDDPDYAKEQAIACLPAGTVKLSADEYAGVAE